MKEEPRAVCKATLREASYSVGRMSGLTPTATHCKVFNFKLPSPILGEGTGVRVNLCKHESDPKTLPAP